MIGEEAERMRRLVEDLLYLGRIESGDLALEREPVDLADLARAVQARFSFRAQETGINFRVDAPEPVGIVGDPHRLGQMLDNLVENAFKHTPAGGSIAVTVTREAARAAGRGAARPTPTAVMSVHNTGSYVSPEEAERVFERFYQVDKARTDPRTGVASGWRSRAKSCRRTTGRSPWRAIRSAARRFIVRLPSLEPKVQASLISSAEPASPAGVAAARRF